MEAFDDPLATRTESEDQTSFADLIDGRGVHCQKPRRATEAVDDACTDLDLLGVNRNLGEQ